MRSQLPAVPAAGSPMQASWGGQVVDNLRLLNQPQAQRRIRPAFRTTTPAVALTWTFDGLVGTLSAGILLLRGALVTVAAQSVTMQSGANYTWLQFSIDPAVTPTPALTRGSAWPTLSLGTTGYWPLALHTVTSGAITAEYLYHPGGNAAYPVD